MQEQDALADVRGCRCPCLVDAADDRKFYRPSHTLRGPVAVVQSVVIRRVDHPVERHLFDLMQREMAEE